MPCYYTCLVFMDGLPPHCPYIAAQVAPPPGADVVVVVDFVLVVLVGVAAPPEVAPAPEPLRSLLAGVAPGKNDVGMLVGSAMETLRPRPAGRSEAISS